MSLVGAELSRIGKVAPAKWWVGPASVGGLTPTDLKNQIVETVIRQLFDGPAYELAEYSEVSFEIGIALTAISLRLPDLRVLGIIGKAGEFIPDTDMPTSADLGSVRKMVRNALGDNDIRCVTNVNETGGFFQVDPHTGDLLELLVVFFSEQLALALYWGEPMD